MGESQNQLEVLLQRFRDNDISDEDLSNLIYMLQQNIHTTTLRLDKTMQTLKKLESARDFFLERLDDVMEIQKERESAKKYRDLGKRLIEKFGDGVDIARLIVDEEDKQMVNTAIAKVESESETESTDIDDIETAQETVEEDALSDEEIVDLEVV